MTGTFDESPGSRWDFFRMWQHMARPLAELAADEGLPMWGTRAPLQALLDGVRSSLVGRPLVMGAEDRRVALTLTSLDASLDPVAAAVGQVEDVTLAAENVQWRTYQFTAASATLRNVHTRWGARPLLVCAPVDLTMSMAGERLASMLVERTSSVQLDISDEGRMRLALARRPNWGWVEFRPVVERGCLVVRPTGLARAKRRWQFKRQMPAFRLKVLLPDAMRIVGLEVRSNRLDVQLRIDEWRLDYLSVMSMVGKSR
jgi:hypothetical protein